MYYRLRELMPLRNLDLLTYNFIKFLRMKQAGYVRYADGKIGNIGAVGIWMDVIKRILRELG